MDKLMITGGEPLRGEVKISGAKTRHCLYWLQHYWRLSP